MISPNPDTAMEVSESVPSPAPSEEAATPTEERVAAPHSEELHLWNEYEAHAGAGRYAEAEAALEELYRRNWRRRQVCLGLARLAGATRQHGRAARYLEEAERTAPLNPSQRLSLAKHLIATGELSRALDVLAQAQTVCTGSALIRCLQTAFSIRYEMRDWAAAEKCLAAILAIEPENQAAWLGLVDVAVRRHDHGAVIDLATRALAVMPGDARLLAIRSNARLHDGSGRAAPGEMPRVLILSAVVPGGEGSGGRYFQSVIDLYPRDRLAFFCITKLARFKPPADMPWLPIGFASDPIPRSKLAATEGSERFSSRMTAWEEALTRESKEIAAEVLRFAQRHGSEVIVFAATPLLFRVALEIRALSPIRIAMMVLDPLEIRLTSYQVPAPLHQVIHEDFDAAMKIVDRCATSSDNMAEEYQRQYGHEPLVMLHGLARDVQRKGRHRRLDDRRLTIAMLGALYASDAVAAFVQALVAADWKIGERSVSLICMTREPPPGTDPTMPIEHLGWIEQDDVVSTLDRADLAYVPYWFDERYSETVRLAFPSKTSAMAAAGVPIFFHGPAYSSVTRFLKKHPMGVACSSLDPADIVARLEEFFSSPGRYAAAAVASETAFAMEMNHDVFRDRFMKLVGAEPPPAEAAPAAERVLSGTIDSGYSAAPDAPPPS